MNRHALLWMVLGLSLTACNDDDNRTTVYVEQPDSSAEQSNTNVNQPGAIELSTESETDFFALTKHDENSYDPRFTNSGTFHFDVDGYLVNEQGYTLRMFPTNPDGTVASVSLASTLPVQIHPLKSNETQTVSLTFNLPASASELDPTDFDHTDSNTYSVATSVPLSDSTGERYTLTIYLLKSSDIFNTWEMRATLADQTSTTLIDPVTDQVLDFDESGSLDPEDQDLDGMITTNGGEIRYNDIPLSNGADDLAVVINVAPEGESPTTSLDANFNVKSLTPGTLAKRLLSVSFDKTGLVTLNYSGDEQEIVGKIALVKFPSPYNLEDDSGMWKQTEASGEGLAGEPGGGAFGLIVPIGYDY